MPSLLHEALLEMFRDEPTLIPQLVREVHHVQVPRDLPVHDDRAEFNQIVLEFLKKIGNG